MSKNTKAKTAGFDPAAWATAQPAKGAGGVPCWICTHPPAAEAVATWVRGNEDGKWAISFPRMAEALREHFGYPYRAGAVGNHAKLHGATHAR